MMRLLVQSWIVAVLTLTVCAQHPLFAQEDSNASIMAGLDGNASEMAFSTGSKLPVRRNLGVAIHPSTLKDQKASRPNHHRDDRVVSHSPAIRDKPVAFEPFGIPPNQGGLSNSVFRVYGEGYGFGYSFNYFGNYGQGYGTGYCRNYFGNYGYGYGIGYGPKQ